jgi:hypothetical protein
VSYNAIAVKMYNVTSNPCRQKMFSSTLKKKHSGLHNAGGEVVNSAVAELAPGDDGEDLPEVVDALLPPSLGRLSGGLAVRTEVGVLGVLFGDLKTRS